MTTWTTLESVRHQVAIAGQVSDAQTGQVIHRARVEITKMPDSFKKWLTLHALQYGAKWETMTERPDRKQTAIDGHFHFLDLPDGDYTIKASLPSAGTRYGSVEQTVQVSRNGDRIKREAAHLALPPTGISGQIKNSKNSPVIMAKVQIQGRGESTFSDSQGNYLLSGLEESKLEYTVNVSAPSYLADSQSIQLEQGKVKKMDFHLKLKSSEPAN